MPYIAGWILIDLLQGEQAKSSVFSDATAMGDTHNCPWDSSLGEMTCALLYCEGILLSFAKERSTDKCVNLV